MSRSVYVYVFYTMADWEIGFLTTELNSGRYFKRDALPVKVVTLGNLITATGIAPLEFTANVLKTLEVLLPEALDAWYNLYKTQEQECFYELMTLIQ